METKTQMELANENQNPNGMGQWKPKPQLTHKKNQFHYFHMHTHNHPSEYIPKFTNMQSLSSTLQICISNLHALCKLKPQLTHKKQRNFTICIYVHIHKHHCESKPKLINMQSLSIILQACIQLKKKSSRVHIFP